MSLQRVLRNCKLFFAIDKSVCNVPPGPCKALAFPLRFHTGSGLVRSPQKAAAFCPFLRVPGSMCTEHFAVCGRRLRGHVPSKNTSPTVLSWIRLTTPTTPVLSVPARYFPLSPHKKCTPDFSDVHMISKVILRACVRRKYMRIFEQIFLQTRQKFAGILSYGKNFSRSMQQNFPKRRR